HLGAEFPLERRHHLLADGLLERAAVARDIQGFFLRLEGQHACQQSCAGKRQRANRNRHVGLRTWNPAAAVAPNGFTPCGRASTARRSDGALIGKDASASNVTIAVDPWPPHGHGPGAAAAQPTQRQSLRSPMMPTLTKGAAPSEGRLAL